MSAVVAAAEAAKADGQERAGRALRPEHWTAFTRALAAIPMGKRFTMNDLRADLAAVPERSRASLLNRATHAGLIEKVFVRIDGELYELAKKSDGLSARRKPISVYQRMAPSRGGAS